MLYCGQDDPFYRKRKYERGGGTKRGEENGDFAYRYEMSRGSSKRSNEALNVITLLDEMQRQLSLINRWLLERS